MTFPCRPSWFVYLLLVVAALLVGGGWGPTLQAQAQEQEQEQEITVSGQIVNGTPGGAVPADLPVTLRVFSGRQETGTYTTSTDADGRFQFAPVVVSLSAQSPDEQTALQIETTYQGVRYFTNVSPAEMTTDEVSVPLHIYETTDDPAGVHITQLHFFVTVVEGQVWIAEYHLLGNSGERTYVGTIEPGSDQQTTVHVSLPVGAEGLDLHTDEPTEAEQRFVIEETGFADTAPIPPGDATSDILFEYALPYREGMTVTRSFEAPVASVVLLLSSEGFILQSDQLSEGSLMNTEMGPTLSYTAGPLAPDESLAFRLVPGDWPVGDMAGGGSSVSPEQVAKRDTTLESIIGLGGLLIALGGAYWLWQGGVRRRVSGRVSGGVSPLPLSSQVKALVQELAALDDDFDAGQVEPGEYQQRRQTLKQALKDALKDTLQEETG